MSSSASQQMTRRQETRAFERLFSPRGVAVIGASRNPSKLGYAVARNLLVSGYRGALYFVNPAGGRLFERRVYRSVDEVPDPVDLAILLIPAAAVPQVLEAAGRRGIPYAIIGAGGFRETGPEGAALEERCLAIARRYGMRLVGPNCIGILDTHVPIDTTFLPQPGPAAGEVGFLSHSGAICEAVIDWSRGQGFGLSRLVSLGNQADLTETDLIQALAADPHTRVIVLYLEGVRDGRLFLERARQVTAEKPVLAIKVGRSREGQRAVASHTGALAGEDRAYEAAFRKAGVLRARHSEQVFDWARALAWCPLPAGRRVAVVTNAGGPGAIAVDALVDEGLQLSPLQPATIERLQKILPPAASAANPVDMLATAGPDTFAACLSAVLQDEHVDAVMVVLPPPPMATAADIAHSIIPIIQESSKPVVVALMGQDLVQTAAELFRKARVADYRFPERAASALGALVRRAEMLRQRRAEDGGVQAEEPPDLSGLLAERAGEDGFLSPMAASAAVAAYHVSTPAERLAKDEEGALQAARMIGFPVALKWISPGASHKSDLGLVLLDLQDEEGLFEGIRRLRERAKQGGMDRWPAAFLVQQMVPEGQEVIVGVVRDPQFGPLVMFGSGGVEVEGLGDVAFALAPLSRAEAEELMDRTWAGRRLRGYRSLPPADREAVIEVLLGLSRMAVDYPEIAELEINPLRVFPAGQGALALDVRMRVGALEATD